MTPPTTSRAACWRRLPTARACPSRCSTARTRRSTARRRCSSTATAPTASPCRRASPPAGSSLVDRGFVFAIAHVRGGKDKGYRWYTEGKREKKINTFTDFIAAGEFLVKEGYTRRGRIVANGGSAGGMLMGVVANMAPELFLGIIADVPFVDVLNTMLDESLPLTPPEWPEWGNPIASKQDFETIRSYSPYDNVAAKAYPHIFAYAGLTDPRVTYWEPAKWIARLRHLNTGHNLLLLKTNMEAGHGGASGRFEALKELALDYAFALKICRQGRRVTSGPERRWPRLQVDIQVDKGERADLDAVVTAAAVVAWIVGGILGARIVVGSLGAGIVVARVLRTSASAPSPRACRVGRARMRAAATQHVADGCRPASMPPATPAAVASAERMKPPPDGRGRRRLLRLRLRLRGGLRPGRTVVVVGRRRCARADLGHAAISAPRRADRHPKQPPRKPPERDPRGSPAPSRRAAAPRAPARGCWLASSACSCTSTDCTSM